MTDTAAPRPGFIPPVFGDKPEGTHVWQRVPYNPDDYGPVDDFATDFDHADPAYNPSAPEVWKSLREGGCPVAHSERYGGMWVPLTHETVHEVAYDTEHFTSRSVVVSVGRPGDLSLPAPIGGAPPITSDPPVHGVARRLLLPAFAPKKIEPWEPEVRRLCNDLLDRIGEVTPGETVIDAAVQYAQHIPVNVIGRMLGFPEKDEDLFRKFVHDTLERIAEDMVPIYNSPFAVETAHIKFHKSDVSARIIRSLFDTARQYRESIDVYGSKKSFEWPLIEGEEPVIHTAKKPEPEIPQKVKVPDFAHRLPKEIQRFTTKGVYGEGEDHLSFTQGGGHGGSHPHLANEFIQALLAKREPFPNARQSANWTCTGILAHESAMAGGEIRKLPAFTLPG